MMQGTGGTGRVSELKQPGQTYPSGYSDEWEGRKDRKVQYSSQSKRQNQGPQPPRDSLFSPFLGLVFLRRKSASDLLPPEKSSQLNCTQHWPA